MKHKKINKNGWTNDALRKAEIEYQEDTKIVNFMTMMLRIIWFICIFLITYFTLKAIQEKGLKNILDPLWNGQKTEQVQ